LDYFLFRTWRQTHWPIDGVGQPGGQSDDAGHEQKRVQPLQLCSGQNQKHFNIAYKALKGWALSGIFKENFDFFAPQFWDLASLALIFPKPLPSPLDFGVWAMAMLVFVFILKMSCTKLLHCFKSLLFLIRISSIYLVQL